MSQNLATPGVYVEEKNAFSNSVAAVPTAVPAFIGYTEKSRRDGRTLINKPVRISSLSEFYNIFGGGPTTTFNVQSADANEDYDFEIGNNGYKIVSDNKARFMLYDSIRLFFANGGSTCWVVSAGSYYSEVTSSAPASKSKDGKDSKQPSSTTELKQNAISKKSLQEAMDSLYGEEEPTMLVIPEAVMLDEADCFALQQDMLSHCGYRTKSRFAILDVYDGTKARSYDKNDVITRFREGIGSNFLAYGAAYYPWVYTSVVQNEELSYANISNTDKLKELLSKEAEASAPNAKKADEIKAEINKIGDANDISSLTQTLKVISPSFEKILQKIKTHLNVLPASAAMAGVYTMIDGERGVWKAPANLTVSQAIAPMVRLTQDDQEDLNVTPSGKSVNAIRAFVGEGTTVWGARTLDGNSQDWRYINVRRTITYIEQSIKKAAKAYVYEPNNSGTWVLVRSMINSFLNDIWRQGGLVGLTPADAFEVQVGLGSTMTPNDILDGVMNISVKVAVSRPAEFIVITFQQKMQES
ncbi:phage tail sheath subtilisin-like domain-containing protein [Mangrovivirga sp. M17]|uniref:Phage tail sheath subtilisin-like domain-containing protein n=1 Tax=Mangrovivirga halotolerans TaxID=2993936 RepID=A0ABT3RML5_9BACT|nr:phage tail sheath C-terminal domain-containing protein [Mangrovivirga halotolerans]MCX2742701.1 phage tail sheath subtilisin-like domain-containing protein [Mangrovivirga halotolerans]